MIDRLDASVIRQPLAIVLVGTLFAFLLIQLNALGLLIFALPLGLGAVAGLVIARHPWLGFALLVFTVPFQRLGSEGTLLPVTLTQLVFPVAVAGYLLSFFADRRSPRGHVLLVPYTLLLFVMIASAFQAASFTSAMAEIARWTVALGAFWLALQIVVGSSDRRIVGFVALLAFGGVFEATIGIVQSVIGFGPFELSSGVSRAFGTFGRPNSFAGYLEMTLFPAVLMAVWYAGETLRRYRVYATDRLRGMEASRDSRRRLYLGAAALIGFSGSAAIILSGIVASLSRGAWLGVAVGGLAVALALGPITRIATIIAILAVAAILIGGQGGLIPGDVRERVAEASEQFRPSDVRAVPVTDENFASVERLAHWQTGMNMYRAHPVFGVGVGNYNERFEEFSIREDFRKSQGHAHNYYIHTLAETGLVGLLAYLTLLVSVIVLALRVLMARSARGTLTRAIVLGAFGSIIAVSTHNVFENLHVLNLGIIISLHWALVVAGHERWRSESLEAAGVGA